MMEQSHDFLGINQYYEEVGQSHDFLGINQYLRGSGTATTFWVLTCTMRKWDRATTFWVLTSTMRKWDRATTFWVLTSTMRKCLDPAHYMAEVEIEPMTSRAKSGTLSLGHCGPLCLFCVSTSKSRGFQSC